MHNSESCSLFLNFSRARLAHFEHFLKNVIGRLDLHGLRFYQRIRLSDAEFGEKPIRQALAVSDQHVLRDARFRLCGDAGFDDCYPLLARKCDGRHSGAG